MNLADIGESPIDLDIAWPQGQLTIDLSPDGPVGDTSDARVVRDWLEHGD